MLLYNLVTSNYGQVLYNFVQCMYW